ncbi:LA_0364 family Cys-rich lipoprotein [Leptospira abararensis]|uniref:LA_0364 family Cys-rich lipoprotein n=1 Tax=Leptospira abararensis TaxID=2810036 RepID=UPI0038CC13E0
MKQTFVFLFFSFFLNCGSPFSFRSACYERNKCSTIEGECFLRNDAFYKISTSSPDYSPQDLAAIVGSCLGLEKTCKKNCESGTIF